MAAMDTQTGNVVVLSDMFVEFPFASRYGPIANGIQIIPGDGHELALACSVCGIRGLKQCGSCKKVMYCGRACQKAAWKTISV
jgi:hypothetical protein